MLVFTVRLELRITRVSFSLCVHVTCPSSYLNHPQPQPTTAQRCRSETEKNILEDLFSSVLSQLKKNTPLETCLITGSFQSFKFRNLMEKILAISLKLTPNTLGCYGLR